MSSVAHSPVIGVEEYLSGEERSEVKHEYVAGEVFAMAGASEAHVTIALNLAALLRNQVRGGPCRVYISDMKVRVESASSFFYPDVFVTCDPADRGETQAKYHPILIVEVLSESTAAFDRGAKFAHYRRLDSLREYLLIEPGRRSLDLFRRDASGSWVLHAYTDRDVIELASLDFRCSMDAIYEDVDLT